MYRAGEEPDERECAERVARYWRPYHDALAAELERIRAAHGFVVLLDGHSIRSRVPALFEGRLPDLNLGSNSGASAAPDLVARAMGVLDKVRGASAVLDGRFRGGHITRHYGRPDRQVHALQLEMAQSLYMREQPPRRDPGRMQRLQEALATLLWELLGWRPD